MKTYVLSVVLLCLVLLVSVPASGQQKLAQTGMKFLSVDSDPRAAAMGGALTAVEGSGASAFFNPAGTARLGSFGTAFFGYTGWIADIKHMFGAVSISPEGGAYGTLSFMAQVVDYGEFEQTIFSLTSGYIELEPFHPKGTALGVGYSRALSEKFAIGGNVKYVSQNLGEAVINYDETASSITQKASNKAGVVAFDFGLMYRTGFKSLTFGMCIRNFSKEARFVDEGFQLPLTFRMGLSMNILDLTDLDPETHALLLVVDAEHPRDYAEQLKVGGEYLFMKTLALRAGYVFPADEHGLSLGGGVRTSLAGVTGAFDYSYTPFGIFGSVHRFGVQFTM
jgi:hypothetical protein